MQVVPKPGALPGACVMPACGSGSRDRYLDTGLQFEFYGAVFICDLCMGEMARMFGFLEPEYVQELKNKLAEAEADRYLLSRQVDGLRMVVDGFTLARGTGGTDSVSSALLAPDLASPEPPSVRTELDPGAIGPPEPLHDEGVAELSDDGGPSPFQLNI